jgi:hypothetical protein
VHKLTISKVALLIVNALVLLYLLKVVVDRRRRPEGSLAA